MKSTRATLFGAIAFVLQAGNAEAHGEEGFGTFFAQGAVVIVGTVALLLWRWKPALKGVALSGGLLGVPLSWIATARIPYSNSSGLITALFVTVPVVCALLGVYIVRARQDRDKQT